MKLSKMDARNHQHALDLLKKDRLSEDERWFVLEHYHPGAQHMNSVNSAYFTPLGLARDLVLGNGDGSLIDLCAGIGTLAFHACLGASPKRKVVCVEKNPDYVAAGRKLLPNATWICGDVFSLPANIGRFSLAISNPPFSSAHRSGKSPRCNGRWPFEYHLMDIAVDMADAGVFLIPQSSCPFQYSFKTCYEPVRNDLYQSFQAATGIELSLMCGIDTKAYQHEWRSVSPITEVVEADFTEARRHRPPSLF